MYLGCPRWLVVGWLAVAACDRPAGEPCADAIGRHDERAGYICLGQFVVAGDPSTGARAARQFEGDPAMLPMIEPIAIRIGDQPAGADAWGAVGAMHNADADAVGAIAAFERAAAHRDPADRIGRIGDALGMSVAHSFQDDLLAVSRQLVIAYELSQQIDDRDQRVRVGLNVAGRILEVGDLGGARRALDETKRSLAAGSKYYGFVRGLEANVDSLREQWHSARQALLEAIAFAERQRDDQTVWASRLNLIEAETKLGNLAAAGALVERVKAMKAYSASAVAYYEAQLLIATGRLPEAAAVLTRGLDDKLRQEASSDSAALEALLGQVLIATGDRAGAERNLRAAIAAREQQRDRLELDSFKSWLLAKRREPYEDLFRLYVEQDRVRDALALAQQMRARSILDGLVQDGIEPGDTRTEIVKAGQHAASLRKLAGLLRASPTASVPPIDAVLARLRGTTVLTYVRARDAVWLIVLAETGALQARRIGEVAAVTGALYRLRSEPQSDDAAAALGALLLPDDILPPPGRELYIVPDELLSDVSFAALRTHATYLVDRNPVAYAPSAAILAVARTRTAARRAVVIGDPTSDRAGARAEAGEVGRLLGAAPSIGATATKATVLGAGDAEVLHVASHAGATHEGPVLRMSDGDVLGTAIVEHRVGPALVVLTGCSSAHADEERDEFGSLAAAFIAAGAATVIASRIDVDDAVARRFAQLFYEANGVRDPVGAVAQAQRRLRSEGVRTAQWSTFMVIGGLRTPSTGRGRA